MVNTTTISIAMGPTGDWGMGAEVRRYPPLSLTAAYAGTNLPAQTGTKLELVQHQSQAAGPDLRLHTPHDVENTVIGCEWLHSKWGKVSITLIFFG